MCTGNDGMGDIGLPLHGRAPAAGHAVDALRRVINENAGDIELVTLGPFDQCRSRLAARARVGPTLSTTATSWVASAAGHGNVTPTAEFNIWVDPEAAKIVYESGMDITMVGWDISWKYATFDAEQAEDIRRIGTSLAEFVVDIQATLTEFSIAENALPGFDLPDPITMAAAIDRSICQYQNRHVEVTIGDGLARGITVVDWLGITGQTPQIQVATSADRDAFVRLLKQCVS